MPIITNVRAQPRRPLHLGVYTTNGFYDGFTRDEFAALKWPEDMGDKPKILTVSQYRALTAMRKRGAERVIPAMSLILNAN